ASQRVAVRGNLAVVVAIGAFVAYAELPFSFVETIAGALAIWTIAVWYYAWYRRPLTTYDQGTLLRALLRRLRTAGRRFSPWPSRRTRRLGAPIRSRPLGAVVCGATVLLG